ncbi:MAG: glycosyltransferase family 4 protein [Caldimicrobium sp.]
MKKILLIRPKIGFGLGGAETHAAQVAIKLIERGFKVSLIAHKISFPKDYEAFLEFYPINYQGFGSVFKQIYFIHAVKNLLTKLKYDYIISFFRIPKADLFILCDPLFAFLVKQKKPLLWNFRPRYKILLHLEKKALLTAKKIISIFKLGKDLISQYYPQVFSKVSVCYRGIDFKKFNPKLKEKKYALRKLYGFTEEDYLILFVGYDTKRKGLPLLLEIMPFLPKRVKLLIAGKEGKPQNNIFYLGKVKEVENLYALADLFVLPTFYDPGALATLEALASGTPVITSPFDGTSEFIKEGINGYVTTLNKEDLKNKILAAMEKTFDPEICYNSIKFLTWDNYVDCLISQLEDL